MERDSIEKFIIDSLFFFFVVNADNQLFIPGNIEVMPEERIELAYSFG
jgi:hypothetical protein